MRFGDNSMKISSRARNIQFPSLPEAAAVHGAAVKLSSTDEIDWLHLRARELDRVLIGRLDK